MPDPINHPQHYGNGPFECILLAEQYSFNVGNMIKYVWRHKDKDHPKEDLEKALWYAKQAMGREEAFAPCDRHYYDSLRIDFTERIVVSAYDADTLARIKAISMGNGPESNFWYNLSSHDAQGALNSIERMLEELK